MQFALKMTGDEHAARNLRQIGNRAVHAGPLLNKLGKEILDLEKERFDRGRFKPLAKSTKARKRRQGLSRRPLKGATGDLERSLTHKGGQNIFRIDTTSVTVGTRVFYARFHQEGEGVPKRQPLAITPKQRRPLARMILRFLREGTFS